MVYLHIGAMKTGTTFVQSLLMQNREQLAAAGLLIPGKRWAEQVHAVRDVLGGGLGYPNLGPKSRGAWGDLRHEILAADSASIVSMEFLSFADPRRARRIVDSLAPADVHVVLTVRDATPAIPALWQTNTRTGSTDTWRSFMNDVRRAAGWANRWGRFSPSTPLRTFLRTQDVAYMVRTWRRVLPAGRIHVVTVPGPGAPRTLLWERLAAVVGVPPETCTEPPAHANESIGYPSTELLRRVNAQLGRVPAPDYNQTVLEFLALRILAARRDIETRALLDRRTAELGPAWNDRSRQAIGELGIEVEGDLGELPTELGDQHEELIVEDQPPPSDAELLDAALPAERAMRRLIRRRARRLTARGVEVDLPLGLGGPHPPRTWRSGSDPVEMAVRQVAGLVRTAMDLQRRLRG